MRCDHAEEPLDERPFVGMADRPCVDAATYRLAQHGQRVLGKIGARIIKTQPIPTTIGSARHSLTDEAGVAMVGQSGNRKCLSSTPWAKRILKRFDDIM